MEYLMGEKRYSISYRELQEVHYGLSSMEDAEFMAVLPEALHAACIISWFKELPLDATLGDEGIVHELVHLLHLGETTEVTIPKVREQFNRLLQLA